MALPVGILASADNSIGVATISNTSGTPKSDMVVSLTIPYSAGIGTQVQTDFSRMKFFANGSLCQHWVGHVRTGQSAHVYVKLPSVTTGENKLGLYPAQTNLSSSSGMFKVFTDFPTSSIPSGWEIMSNGANRLTDAGLTQSEIDNINNYTIVPGKATLCINGGGPVSILGTTSDVGVNVAVDTKALLKEDTNGVSGWGAIWELGLHGQPIKNNILIKNGIKYRWDARYNNNYMGLVTSYSRTNGVATLTIDQSQKRANERTVLVGDEFSWSAPDATWNIGNTVTATITNKQLTNKVATLTTSAAHGFVVDDVVSITGVDATFNTTVRVRTVPTSTTFTYAINNVTNVASTAVSPTGTATMTTVKVKTVSYNGNTMTITYDNPGQTNVPLTTYTNAYPTRFFSNVIQKNHQSFLDGPYGGTYTANGATNSAGWNNFDIDIFTEGNSAQQNTSANGTPVMRGAPAEEVWSLRYSDNTYRPYVNNIATGRNYVVGTTTKYVTGRSLSSNIASINTSGPHGLKVGDQVTISGVGAPFDGVYVVYTVPGGFNFTFQKTNADIPYSDVANPLITSVSYADATRGLNGKASIQSHIGAAELSWVAIYDTFNGVGNPVYVAGI